MFWQHHVGHGLWRDYALSAQSAIRQGLARSQSTIVVEDLTAPAYLDVGNGYQITSEVPPPAPLSFFLVEVMSL